MIVVYSLTIIIGGVWVLRMISGKKLLFKKTPLDLPLLLFLASQIISTLFSIDPHTSVWGYYSRSNGGLLSTISYLFLYYAFVSNFTKEHVIKFLKFAVFAGGAASLYAIPEHFGVSPSCVILTHEFSAGCWVQDVQARVFGTLGQPNWLAAYLGMLIFPAIYFFLSAKELPQKVLYFLLITAYYLAFTFTYSRGATLGLIAGFAVLALSQLLFSRPSGGKLNISILKPMVIIAGGFLLINLLFGSALTELRLLKNPAVPLRPGLSQATAPSGTQLENGGTESGQIRLIVWKGALDIFRAYPLFGSGVETFAYAYYQFRPGEHNLVSEWDFLYNKAHNEYLNYLATTGIFGFLSYLAIIVVFLLWVMRYGFFATKEATHNSLLITSLSAGYIFYLIQNFFLFSVVIIAVLFYLFPAFAFVYAGTNKELSEKNGVFKTINSLLTLINKKTAVLRSVQGLVIIVILVLLNWVYSIWEADTLYKKGTDYNDLGNPGRAYNYLIDAVRLNSKEPLYLAELGNAAASSALALSEEDSTTSGELKDDSVFFTDLSLSISPINTTILRSAIRTYFQLSLIDPSFQPKTLEVINRSIELAPTDPKLLLNKAVILTQFEKEPEAVSALQKAIELKPNYREARLNLADLLIKSGQKDSAQIQLDSVLKLFPGDADALTLQESLK